MGPTVPTAPTTTSSTAPSRRRTSGRTRSGRPRRRRRADRRGRRRRFGERRQAHQEQRPGRQIANDSLTGTQINESSVGAVPTASSIDGYPSGSFYGQQASAHQQTSECTQNPPTWTECASISVTAPSNHLWYVTVISSVTANPCNANVEALFCPAYTGPQCLDSTPDRVTFPAKPVRHLVWRLHRFLHRRDLHVQHRDEVAVRRAGQRGRQHRDDGDRPRLPAAATHRSVIPRRAQVVVELSAGGPGA